MLLIDKAYHEVWDKVYNTLHFRPSTNTEIIPFVIQRPYTVFDISKQNDNAPLDPLVTNAFINCTHPGEKMYALDWQHSAFLFDPRILEEQQNIYLGKNPFLPGSNLYAYFPSYYPNGDYYFFIDEKFRFGYLSHPWREEIWVFGADLIKEIKKSYKQLGWVIKEDLF